MLGARSWNLCFGVVSVLGGLLACGAKAPRTGFETGSRTAPAWVQGNGVDPEAFPAARYLTGYGLSGPGGTGADQRRQALAMARAALAASIRVRVSSEFTSRVTEQDLRMTRFAQNWVRTQGDLELEGLDTLLVWRDRHRQVTHALAVLDKARTLQLLADQTASQAIECREAFEAGSTASDLPALLQARHLRDRIDQALLMGGVLSGGFPAAPACPTAGEINRELRRIYGRLPGLDGHVALAALDLGEGLPRGIRVLMDRITFADTPFCGSFSAYLERALGDGLAGLGEVRIVDRAGAGAAMREQGLDADLADLLRSQAVVRGTLFDLGEDVQLNLRVTSAGGEELAATTQTIPAAVIRKAQLKLVPDNFKEAQQALALDEAKIQSSNLTVKVALDRGEGGIYRQGEKLTLLLKANLDCYAKVIYQQVDGTKVLIFPNKYHPDSRVDRDRLYRIPPDDHSFDLVVQEPFGVEMVQVLASTEPIDVQGREDGHGLSVVEEDLAALLGRTRGISLRKAEAQYAEATAVVNTMPADAGAGPRNLQ